MIAMYNIAPGWGYSGVKRIRMIVGNPRKPLKILSHKM